MQPAVENYKKVLAEVPFNVPTINVISNVDLSRYTSVLQIQDLLAKQLFMPVRWTETLGLFADAGIDSVIECGPAKVLSGLAKRTIPQLKNMFCFEPQHLPEWEVV